MRAQLPAGIDADALERLLQRFPEGTRASHFDMFAGKPDPPTGDASAGDVRTLTRISDPVLHRLLEECWQPYWATQPTEMLEREIAGPPGRDLALRRRRGEQCG